MIHYSCDRCRREIDPEELRFSVVIEVQVAIEDGPLSGIGALNAGGVGVDSSLAELGELQELLQQFDDDEREEISQRAYQHRQYDLCSDCQREYLKNPLAVDAIAKVGFSEN